MPEHNEKPKSAKRRRVRFADDPTPVSNKANSNSAARRRRRRSEDPKWQAPIAESSNASLLQDASIDQAVTKFDLKEELREGTLCGEDGIIPNQLVIDDNDTSSSGDETIPKKKRRGESHQDDDDTLNLSDAIVEVISVLQPEHTPAEMQTPAARVLASSNLGDRKREDLLVLVPKWSLCWGAPGTRAHGPFTTPQMLTWARARYFCQPNRMGFVRPLGGCKWAPACDVFSSDQNA